MDKMYLVSGVLTVSAYTYVAAASEEEAIAVAEMRDVADLALHAFCDDATEAWHIENDGEPEQITAKIAAS